MRTPALALLLMACAAPLPADTGSDDPTPGPGVPPTAAQGVSVQPAQPNTLQDLLLVVATEPTDEDGDQDGLQIRWTRDGEVMSFLDGARTVPAIETARDQVWEVSVWGIDLMGNEGPVVSASVSILNLPPGTPTVTVRPEAPVAGEDDLVCSAQANDPDGDDLTYALTWTWGEVVVQGRRVPADRLRGDQEWTCTAVASDGVVESAPSSASVLTLQPPIPTFTLQDVNPTSPRYRRDVSPRDYLEKVSGWYFTHAT